MSNPFERYELDPRDGIVAITQRLRELAEDTTDDAERERIRQAWEELTLHPARRLRAALFAHPETREPLGTAPALPRRRLDADAPGLDLRELTPRPSLLATLTSPTPASDVPSLGDDPLLRPARGAG